MRNNTERKVAYPPGPPWYKVWSEGPKIDRAKFMLDLHNRYGDVMRIRGLKPIYAVRSPEYVRQILTKAWPDYTKNTIDYRVMGQIFGAGLVTNDGQSWAKQRRLIQPVFANSNVNRFDDIINSVTQKLVDKWYALSPNEAVWLDQEMSHITFQIVCRTLFGENFDHHAGEIAALLRGNNRHTQSFASLMTLFPWIPTANNKRFIRNKQKLDRIVYEIIDAHQDGQGKENDIVHRLLSIQDPDTGLPLDKVQIRDEILTLMLAGHETSATTLNWTFYLLSKNPEVKQKLEKELGKILNGSPARSEDLERLPYLKKVVQESMRIYPPAWGLARKTSSDSIFGKYKIPAQSYISIIIYAIHRHPEFWPHPEVFDPERFSSEQQKSRHPYAYLPFSAGPRACIGANMSMLEIQLILAQLLQYFDIEPIADHPVVPYAGVTLKPQRGIAVNIKRKSVH